MVAALAVVVDLCLGLHSAPGYIDGAVEISPGPNSVRIDVIANRDAAPVHHHHYRRNVVIVSRLIA
jgi:hypothetical protein